MSQNPNCVQCNNSESIIWRNLENGEICNTCYDNNKTSLKNEIEPQNGENSNNGDEKKIRKSTRSTRYKAKSSSVIKSIPKGKSRRIIFKKTPFKTPSNSQSATTTTKNNLFYNGMYYQIGDIVSVVDVKDNNTYYGQIRGLLVDTYCEKSAYLTWLIPTQSSPPPNERFDPSTYLIGYDEDFPRKLSCMEFVMNAPSNYYFDKDNPFPEPDVMSTSKNNGGFIWQNMATAV